MPKKCKSPWNGQNEGFWHVSNSDILQKLLGQNFTHTFPIDMGPTYQKLAHFGPIPDQLLAVTVRGGHFSIQTPYK